MQPNPPQIRDKSKIGCLLAFPGPQVTYTEYGSISGRYNPVLSIHLHHPT
jgi:hypothetical protein